MPDRDPTEPLRNLSSLEAVEERAFQRGRASAKLTAQVESHEKRLNAMNGSIDRHARATEGLASELGELKAAFERSLAVAAARAEDAKKAAENGVSTRTFVLGVVTILVAIVALIASHA